jgi:ATP-dependent Clp protease ATP-binding subunit ClpA
MRCKKSTSSPTNSIIYLIISSIIRALKEQKDTLHERVKDQEEKMTHLSAEIWRLQTLLEAPKTPQMQHFMVD